MLIIGKRNLTSIRLFYLNWLSAFTIGYPIFSSQCIFSANQISSQVILTMQKFLVTYFDSCHQMHRIIGHFQLFTHRIYYHGKISGIVIIISGLISSFIYNLRFLISIIIRILHLSVCKNGFYASETFIMHIRYFISILFCNTDNSILVIIF